MTVIWSAFAKGNLQQIYDRLVEYSQHHADLIIAGLIKAPEILTSHPLLGRQVPEADNPDVREILFRDYQICYVVRRDAVYIISVIHSRQDVAGMKIKPWQHE